LLLHVFYPLVIATMPLHTRGTYPTQCSFIWSTPTFLSHGASTITEPSACLTPNSGFLAKMLQSPAHRIMPVYTILKFNCESDWILGGHHSGPTTVRSDSAVRLVLLKYGFIVLSDNTVASFIAENFKLNC
jgi:hypothetical protein